MNVFIREIGEEHFSRGKAEGEAKGKAEGLAAGEAKGKAEGKAETLLKLLSHRFGRLPGDVQGRVREADPETLDSWALRILDAKSLTDVFAN